MRLYLLIENCLIDLQIKNSKYSCPEMTMLQL